MMKNFSKYCTVHVKPLFPSYPYHVYIAGEEENRGLILGRFFVPEPSSFTVWSLGLGVRELKIQSLGFGVREQKKL